MQHPPPEQHSAERDAALAVPMNAVTARINRYFILSPPVKVSMGSRPGKGEPARLDETETGRRHRGRKIAAKARIRFREKNFA
jgi:hypothetical protein